MVKKENNGHSGNSLLQTASNRRFGAGRFALLALKGNPKPPVKKVKVPVVVPRTTSNNNNNQNRDNVDATDDRSKVSDMTVSVGESSLLSRPALIKEVHVTDDIDVESSVLDMSMTSGIESPDFPLTRATGAKGGGVPRGPSTRNLFSNIGTSVRTSVQPFSNVTSAYHNHPSNKTVSQSLSHPKGAATKRNMTLNKGIVFTAPSPMTLNRFEVQLGQEKVAPESKEYLEQQAAKKKEEQKELEKEHQRQAKKAVKEELKREFQREQGEGFEAQLEDTFEENVGLKKKSLVKKILGKIRPQSPKKKKHPTSTSQQATQQDGATLDKESATVLARQALMASKQKSGLGTGTCDYPIEVQSPQNADPSRKGFAPSAGGVAAAMAAAAATADMEMSAKKSIPFPVNEILMQQKQDSISDLDASFRQAPVMEIMMGSRDPQSRDDESVSTLGTPRVFQKLDSLLRDPNPDPPAIAPVESMAPPDMVFSQDANPLIDQMESGEKSDGTAAVEKKAALCGACVMEHPRKSSRVEQATLASVANDSQHLQPKEGAQATNPEGSKIVAKVDEFGEEGVEARLDVDVSQPNKEDFLLGEKAIFDQVQVSSPQTDASHTGQTHNSAFSMALDQAILEANTQPNGESVAIFPDVHLQTVLSPIEEVEEIGSPNNAASPNDETLQRESGPMVIDLTDQDVHEEPFGAEEAANFDSLMEMAASKLETKADDKYSIRGANNWNGPTSSNPFDDNFSNERTTRLESPKQVIVGRLVDASTKDSAPVVQGIEVSSTGFGTTHDLLTPRTKGGNKTPLFDLSKTASSVSTGNLEIYEDDGGEMVICSDDPTKLPKSPERKIDRKFPPSGNQHDFSEGLFDLLPSDECSEKKDMLLSQPSNDGSNHLDKLQLQYQAVPLTEANSKEKGKIKNTEEADPKTSPQKHLPVVEESRDVLDHVFEYSDMIFCGKIRKKASQTLKSDIPTNGIETNGSVQTGQQNKKAGALFGAGPLFFMNRGTTEDNTLPLAKTGVSQQLRDTSSRNASKDDDKHANGRPSDDKIIIDVEPDHFDEVRQMEKDAAEGKFLLENDDAYWDTLSTIASTTKDKSSSDSEKYMYETVIPGPIPVEITMASKDIEVKPNSITNATAATHASNTIDVIMAEEALTRESRTPRSGHKTRSQESKSNSPRTFEGPKLSRTGSILSGDDEIQSPPPHASQAEEDETGSKNSRVADLIAVFEPSNSYGSGSKDNPDKNTSIEGNGLLLTVTRSDTLGNESSQDKKTHPNQALQASQKTKGSDKPCPEIPMDSSIKSKQSLKGNRSVSWGFEEIYEARDNFQQFFQPKLEKVTENQSGNDAFPEIQDPGDRAVLSAIAAAAAGSAVSKGLDRSDDSQASRSEPLSEAEERNLFARTLQLSRDLFGSLTPQDLKGTDEEVVKSIFSLGLPAERSNVTEGIEVQSHTSVKSGNGASEHSPIIVETVEDDGIPDSQPPVDTAPELPSYSVAPQSRNPAMSHSPGSNRSPLVKSKLDVLREQRSRALERFQLAKPPAPSLSGNNTTSAASRNVRDRDRLKFYSPNHEHLRATVTSQHGSTEHQFLRSQQPHSTGGLPSSRLPVEDRDNDILSTTSSSSSAPSRKARELRRQLDEALKASKDIRVSQEQLGSELRSFKSRYYRKNDAIEDHALRAITGP